MTLDTRSLRLLVLWGWTLFLLWLWLTGEVLRYLGPRTQWVVTAGALLLALVAAGYQWATADAEGGPRPAKSELVGAAGLLLPILLAMILSGSTLGSLAASRKLAGRGVDLGTLARLESGNAASVTFLDLKAAKRDPELARSKGIRTGRAVSLTGFVSKPPARAGASFELSRFYITCCVADSIPVGVEVDPGSLRALHAGRDEWLTVTGAIARDGRGFFLRALRVQHTHAPSDPYLSFTS